MNIRNGAFRLFRLFGIDVYLHWTWFIMAWFEIQVLHVFHVFAWNIAAYLALFAIVLTHEFGHSLAARSVGGRSDTIVLWPLGGVSYASPPRRAGAVLWTIAAGPLVNVVLLPITYILAMSFSHTIVWGSAHLAPLADYQRFLVVLFWTNAALLFFNILPIFPLDGGQILWSLLWFVFGEFRGLLFAAVVGVAGGLGLLLLAFKTQDWFLAVMAAFLLMNSWRAVQMARAQLAGGGVARPPAVEAPTSATAPPVQQNPQVFLNPEAACPDCGQHPPLGRISRCECGHMFDMFVSHGVCPRCRTEYAQVRCGACSRVTDLAHWFAQPDAPGSDAPPEVHVVTERIHDGPV